MANDNCQKIKLLKLMELLRRETDDQHPMTKTAVCEKLEAIGISCDRRTLGRDIRLLRDQGYEVMEVMVGHDKAYYIADRSFSLPELKILIDAVQAASFIPIGKTDELTEKIAALAGSNEAEILTGSQIAFNTRKHTNDQIYYTVMELEDALRLKKKASFFYYDLDERHERVYRKEHRRYLVEPVALVYNEDNYYLMCYMEKHRGIANFRLDRMNSVTAEDEPISEKALEYSSSVGEYTEKIFKMFNGEEKNVTLEFDPELLGAIFDKFGEKIRIDKADGGLYRVRAKVMVSKVFFGWVFQFAGKMRIISPRSVREAFQTQLQSFMES